MTNNFEIFVEGKTQTYLVHSRMKKNHKLFKEESEEHLAIVKKSIADILAGKEPTLAESRKIVQKDADGNVIEKVVLTKEEALELVLKEDEERKKKEQEKRDRMAEAAKKRAEEAGAAKAAEEAKKKAEEEEAKKQKAAKKEKKEKSAKAKPKAKGLARAMTSQLDESDAKKEEDAAEAPQEEKPAEADMADVETTASGEPPPTVSDKSADTTPRNPAEAQSGGGTGEAEPVPSKEEGGGTGEAEPAPGKEEVVEAPVKEELPEQKQESVQEQQPLTGTVEESNEDRLQRLNSKLQEQETAEEEELAAAEQEKKVCFTKSTFTKIEAQPPAFGLFGLFCCRSSAVDNRLVDEDMATPVVESDNLS